MPIRLNLLAEEQAREEMRRRDPVKRAMWAGGLVVALVLIWSCSLQLQAMIAKAEVSHVEAAIVANTNRYKLALEAQKLLQDAETRLAALDELATNRFLQGTLLNALQQAAADDVSLTRLRSEQIYTAAMAIRPGKTNKQPVMAESIVITLDAKDEGPNPGDQITGYRQVISATPYFKEALGKTNVVRLTNLGNQQAAADGKPYLPFTVECRLPEKRR